MIYNGYNIGPGADLTGADLTGANLTNADLTGANLTGVQSGGILGAPTLSTDYSVINGYIVGPGVNLANAQLAEQDLSNIDLTGADLSFADLTDADLTGVRSGSLSGMPSALPENYSVINGYIVGPGADLSGADLSGANLYFANLTDANLTGADLSLAYLAGADLTGVRSGSLSGMPIVLPENYSVINGYIVGPGIDNGAKLLSSYSTSPANVIDNLTIEFWKENTQVGGDLAITKGEVLVDNTTDFDQVRITQTDAFDASAAIDISDVLLTVKHIIGIAPITGIAKQAADINNDSDVDISDVLTMVKHIIGVSSIDHFDMVDSSGDRITQLASISSGDVPEYYLVMNGDVNMDGAFNEDYITTVDIA